MNIRYHVELSEAERCELTALVGGGRALRPQDQTSPDSAGRRQRARATDDIAAAAAVGGSTGYRTKRRFVEGNLEAALNEEPRAGADRKLTSNEEALLVATACSSPPEDPTEPWQEEHQPNISLPAEPTKPPVPHVMSQAGLRIRVNKSAAVSVEWLLVVASHAQKTRCRCNSAARMLHLRRAPVFVAAKRRSSGDFLNRR